MKWFEGSINQAVATSKSKKAIFVVFVEGKDEASVKFSEAIQTPEVSSCLEKEHFVAIKLESGSETYRFFVQIYQLVPVPSLFFIGENGTPLEIVAGETTAANLLSVVNTVMTKGGKTNQSSSSNLIEAEKNASVTADQENDKVSNTPEKDSVNEKEETGSSEAETSDVAVVQEETMDAKAGSSSEASGDSQQTPAVNTEVKDITVEEKIERARQLIELQRKQRQEEEEKKQREKEIERRKLGRDVQKMRQMQQELEIKQAHEERMREKAAEAAAREKVRQQIAQDKLERKEKELALQQKTQQQTPEQPKPVQQTVDATVARIQFRLPTGNTHMGQFEPTSTLRSLRAYVAENIYIPYRQYTMCTSYPRTELTTDDDDKTLLELQLVPTAVILILPFKSSNVSKSVSSTENVGFFSRFMWSLFTPLIGVYNFVMWYVTGTRGNPRAGIANDGQLEGTDENQATTSATWNGPPGLTRRNLGSQGGTTVRAQGNIHRLHSSADDNDENNTWNGNSTQQM